MNDLQKFLEVLKNGNVHYEKLEPEDGLIMVKVYNAYNGHNESIASMFLFNAKTFVLFSIH